MGSNIVGNGNANGQAVSSLFPSMRFSWEIKSVDAVFCNGVARLNDLSKEAIIQAIKDQDLRFLTVISFKTFHSVSTSILINKHEFKTLNSSPFNFHFYELGDKE